MNGLNMLARVIPFAFVAALSAANLSAASGVFATGAPGSPPLPPPSGDFGAPNVLVILIDDMGPEQLDCYDPNPALESACCPPLSPGTNRWNSTPPFVYAPTPNITRLAQNGVRFTRAFASQVCSPSRGQFMSGSYPFRTGIGTIVTAKGETLDTPAVAQQLDFDPSLLTIGQMIVQGSSHSAAYFGKWHLARDQFYVQGSPSGIAATESGNSLHAPSYAHPALVGWPFFQGLMTNPNTIPKPVGGNHYLWDRVTNVGNPNPSLPPSVVSIVPSTEWATTQQRIDLETWIKNQAGSWFAVWSPSACHGPFDPEVDNTNNLHSGSAPLNIPARYKQMLESFDSELGNLEMNLDSFDPTIWENTVVILLGDNGTDAGAIFGLDPFMNTGAAAPYFPTRATSSSRCQPVRFKGSPYITGTGVPLIVSGPCVVAPGRACDDLADIVDIYATVRDIVGVAPAVHAGFALDSRSLLPAIENVSTAATRRTTSLALMYRPNGPIEDHDGIRMGFTMVLDAASGVSHPGTYRLIRYRQDGCTVTESGCGSTCEPADEFYRTHDAVVLDCAAEPDDILELFPLAYAGALDPYADEYAAVIAALNALSPDIQP